MRWRNRKVVALRWSACCGVAAAVLILAAPDAQAEGGKTVSAAPVVSYGVHETGNTANGGGGEFPDGCEGQFELNRNSFWQLPVTVGDHVTIDWGAVILDSTCLTVYPIGTNDYGLQTAHPEEGTEQGSNGKQEMKFMAPASGNLILDFAATELYSGCTDCAGPYEFTASVRHSLQMNLSVPPTLPINGTVVASVSQNTGSQVPDGLSFWLLAKWYSNREKQTLSTTAASAGGTVSFPLALPPTAVGHNITLKAGRSEDSQYAEVVSNSVTTRADFAAPPLTTHHHRRRHHHHHHHHRRRRHHHHR